MKNPEAEQTICVSCGFCCNGTLFGHANLQAGEKGSLPEKIEQAWFKNGEKEAFRLPCLYFKGKCSIYGQKKAIVCSSYRCKLLKDFSEDRISLDEALQLVKNAHSQRAAILKLAGKVMKTNDNPPFRHLVTEIKQWNDDQTDNGVATEELKTLTAHCNIFEALLIRHFKPDKDFESMRVPLLSRETLHKRHNLSHQEIDSWMGEETSKEALPEKLARMEQLRLFLKITKTLQKEGIWFMVLKGPLLSQRIYDDPCFRYYYDFDLLTKPGSANKVIELLTSAGFRPIDFEWPQSPGRQKIILRYINQYPLSLPGKNMVIELHWRLFKYRVIPPRVFKALLDEHLEETQLGGQRVLQFSHEMELLYLVIHGGMHAWWRLKWLLDVHALLTRHPLDEEKFRALSRRLKARRLVTLCNALLQEYFPGSKQPPVTGAPNAFMLRYARQRIQDENLVFTESAGDVWNKRRYRWLAMPGFRYKISTFKLSTFTPQEVHRKWPPPHPLMVIIRRFFTRGFQVLRRKKQTHPE